MTDDKRLKRFERNMSKINDKKLDYKVNEHELADFFRQLVA